MTAAHRNTAATADRTGKGTCSFIAASDLAPALIMPAPGGTTAESKDPVSSTIAVGGGTGVLDGQSLVRSGLRRVFVGGPSIGPVHR